MQCSCKKWKRRGRPCACFFKICEDCNALPEEMLTLDVIDIRFWKTFHAIYGDGGDMGQLLFDAQAQSYEFKNAGTMLNKELLAKLCAKAPDGYPLLGKKYSAR